MAAQWKAPLNNPQGVWLGEKCPRMNCGGNLYLERDVWGNVKKKCLLCCREFPLTILQMLEAGRYHVQ
jgi:hypothetical protein